MRTRICAELATGHGGSLETALKMVDAAAEAGADAVKVQHYGAVNPKDPQADWLNQSRLHIDAIKTLCERAHGHGLEFWATPFDVPSLNQLLDIGVDRIKIASTQSGEGWWRGRSCQYVVSYPWGMGIGSAPEGSIVLAAVPLYPTPLECAGKANSCEGWSDHTVGLSACMYLIAHDAAWLEVHLKLPGVTRCRDWEKSPEDFRALRQFSEDVETMRSGVSQVFRDRWTA